MNKKSAIIPEKLRTLPKLHKELYSTEELRNIITTFSKLTNDSYYFLDYVEGRLIVDGPSSMLLCAYPLELAESEGFAFLNRLVSPKEKKFIVASNEACLNFFEKNSDKAFNLIYSFDIELSTSENKKQIQNHKLAVLKTCEDDKPWLAIVRVCVSKETTSRTASITDLTTGNIYDFVEDEFVLSKNNALTIEEKTILEWMVKDLNNNEICELLGKVPLSSFKRKKKILYDKLGVSTAAGAIHKAHILNLLH